jgi:Gpi18-like mannosyltransferase
VAKLYQCIFVYWGHAVRGPAPPGGWEGVNNWLLNPWTTYDSQWYLEIAAIGYRETTANFFPLYPLILKICGTELSRALLGVIVSNLAFICALYFLYRLTKIDFSEEIARSTVWVAAFFPTAAFFGAVYTESLFFLLLVLTFYAARQSNWVMAGVYGALAGATRNPAPVIFFSLLLQYYQHLKFNFKRIKFKTVLWLTIVLLGFLLFNLYLYYSFHDPFLSLTSHKYYHRTFTWPWVAVLKDIFILFKNYNFITFLNVFSVFLIFYYSLKYYRLFPLSYLTLLIAITLMNLCYSPVNVHTFSMLRYVSVMFPFIQMLAISFKEIKLNSLKYICIAIYFGVNAIISHIFGLKWYLG